MAPPDDPEHECGWQGYAKTLEKKLVEMEQRLAQLERHRSEKLPPSSVSDGAIGILKSAWPGPNANGKSER